MVTQTNKQYARSQYPPLLIRIRFEVRSSQLEGQILTTIHQYEQILVEQIQERHFIRTKSSCAMLHSEAKGFYMFFRSSQYAGLLQIPFYFKKIRSAQPQP